MDVAFVAVPFDGWGRAGNQARAASALRNAGLVEAFSGLHHVSAEAELVLPPAEQKRGPTAGLVNESALTEMISQLKAEVSTSVADGRFVVVYGGDCTTLLGIVPGLNGGRRTGLVFIDGHEDTMPLDVSQDGEAANTEIGLLLGVTGHLVEGPLKRVVGTLDKSQLALVGQRDRDWRAQHNVGSLADTGVWLRSWPAVAEDADGSGRDAVRHVLSSAEGYWLHVDLDVLAPEEFRSQGVPDVADAAGGLSWGQLRAVLAAAVRTQAPVGLSIAIYDPDQDVEGHDAAQIVGALASLATVLAEGSAATP